MHPIVSISCLLGLVLPLIILFFNKGFRGANRYLAFFLFFASLYVLENFIFFYGVSLFRVAFATTTHAFFYLIGPFAFLYIRTILRDNSSLSRLDYLHFVFFIISFTGYIPYFFSPWSNKLVVAQNIMSENWDMAQFHLNLFLPHKLDQLINLLHTYFYASSLWYLLRYYYKSSNRSKIYNQQFKLIRNWVFVFASIYLIITINFTVAMAHLWIYNNKSVFLDRASVALFFASVVYVGMNLIVMFFPHIMYGLPVDLFLNKIESDKSLEDKTTFSKNSGTDQNRLENNIVKNDLQLFTAEYIDEIEVSLESCISQQLFLDKNFKLALLSDELGIPAHHLTYYFNEIIKVSFSEWRNGLRVAYAKKLIGQGVTASITLEALSLQSGFASQSTFIRAFKKATGNSPSYYMKSFR